MTSEAKTGVRRDDVVRIAGVAGRFQVMSLSDEGDVVIAPLERVGGEWLPCPPLLHGRIEALTVVSDAALSEEGR
jgi:hypothetical protein